MKVITLLVLSSVVYLVLFAGMLRTAGRIFSDISRTMLPFTRENAKRIKTMSVFMAFLAVASPAVEWTLGLVLGVPAVTYHFSLELLIASAVLYCLAHIFEYGAVLQQQADETL